MMDPLTPGMPVDTHTGVGILFGLAPRDAIHLRRGPIEAAGIGLKLQNGDVVWRANLATIEKRGDAYCILDRRAGRIRTDVETLCAALQNIEVAPGITAALHPATQHRAVLHLRGENLSACVSDTDPGGANIAHGVLRAQVAHNADKDNNDNSGDVENAQRTADAINQFTDRAHDILSAHAVNAARIKNGQAAANGVIVRSAGGYRRLKNLLSQLNLKVAVVAGEMTILGLARLFEFESITDPRFTSLPDTDLAEKLRAGLRALQKNDLVFVHIKGTDTAAHDKDPQGKADFIARFDRELAKSGVLESGDTGNMGNIVLGVCADHSTDSVRGEHNGDAVPVLLCNPAGRRDKVKTYNEIDCTTGALGRLDARAFLTSVLDAIGALDNCKPVDLM